VVTAAHCVSDDVGDPSRVNVRVMGHATVAVSELHVHPLWNGDYLAGHDLALLRLPPGGTTGITPVQVGAPYDPGAYAPGTESTIMGYGRTGANDPVSVDLRAADTPLRSDGEMSDLADRWYWFGAWPSQLLIGAGSTGQTTCFGDSGGPLVVFRNAHPVQVGVFSTIFYGPTEDPCTRPAGFSELSGPHLAWVATLVSAVTAAWGTCTDSNGWIGQPAASYTTAYVFPGQQDGPYYWGIGCVNTQPPPTPTGTVPHVIGLLLSQATAAVQQAGLSVGNVIYGVVRTCESIGQVMAQNPTPGTQVPAGSAVSLTVGKKPTTPCP
jgi:hypothetical protein